jgi:hypothetical protein
MKQTQKFIYKVSDTPGHYLLLPGEVDQIKNYLNLFPEKSLKDAFYWFTGSSKNVEDIKLIVEYF